MRFPHTRAESGYSIPMITELVNDTNVQFLDQDDDDGKYFFFKFRLKNCGHNWIDYQFKKKTIFHPQTHKRERGYSQRYPQRYF